MLVHQKITEARKNKGLTQEELADKASVTVRTIQRIESGETVPRNFTLKAIAEALDIPFDELLKKNNGHISPAEQTTDKEDAIHFLQMVNLSSFAYLIIPYVHFLVPMSVLKKKKDNPQIRSVGRKIIRTQIYWIIAVHLAFFMILAYNLGIARYNKYFIHYLWPFFIMYFLNAVVILTTHFKIKRYFR
jgi:transcriptional regulator with XRE-family HTH domain